MKTLRGTNRSPMLPDLAVARAMEHVERGCRRLTGREKMVACRVLGVGVGWLDGRRPKVVKGVTPAAQVAA